MGRRRSPIWQLDRESFKALVEQSETATQVLSYFGLRNAGNNSTTLRNRMIEEGMVWEFSHNRGAKVGGKVRRKLKDSEVFKENSLIARRIAKSRLLELGLIEECAICKIGPIWNGQKLVLVLDHINGIPNDHRKENLRLLCPNCNSQQPTFAGRALKKAKLICKSCGASISRISTSGQCRSCCARKSKWKYPSNEELLKLISESNIHAVANKLGIPNSTLRKRVLSIREKMGRLAQE